MRMSLVAIGAHRGKRECEQTLVEEYVKRTGRYVEAKSVWSRSEAEFWGLVAGASGRSAAKVLLMDSGGKQLTSVEFARVIGEFQDRGMQEIVVGIGGADGWSAASRERADLCISMGKMTLPHGLARVVAAEQIYRAMTILAGHPYHCGH